uniref:Exodeoxyribonuclease III n=1 Tax=uncultured Alphaproteobacteria bacterium TaxID=91750 RepID=A0A6G8F371_9PROT|nr:exodeoxyribonuclease III [uncultured Alphaproteobacteria bacterium]
MKIATYNVNSVNARIENLSSWLKTENPDIVLLQEIKTEYNGFPFFDIQACGYNACILGQKSYNGVAILSRGTIRIICENLPDFADEQSRYLEADVTIDKTVYRVASVYLPNGNPPYNDASDTSKFEYKLRWTDAFLKHAQELSLLPQPVIIGGDFNVIMTDKDVYNPKLFADNALFRPEVRTRLKQMSFLGFHDAFRSLHPDESGYTFWDYTANSLAADFGMRIDYLFLSAPAADRLVSCRVDKAPRQSAKPSDHTPLVTELS